jgi:hypothetical protein
VFLYSGHPTFLAPSSLLPQKSDVNLTQADGLLTFTFLVTVNTLPFALDKFGFCGQLCPALYTIRAIEMAESDVVF